MIMLKQPPKLKAKLNKVIIKEYPELEDLEITPTTKEQSFKSEKYGYDNVTVKAIECEKLNIVPSTEDQSKEGLFDKVTVTGDSELVAENIKSGVEIFGVTGTAEIRGEENAVVLDSVSEGSSSSNKLYLILKEINRNLICTSTTANYVFSGSTNLVKVKDVNFTNAIQINYLFQNCTKLTDIGYINCPKATNTQYVFKGCSSLVNAPEMDISSSTNTAYMFQNCTKLENIPLYDTSNVKNMNCMFYKCNSLTTIPQFDMSKVTNVNMMFDKCTSLTSIPLLDLSSVTLVSNFFSGCYNIEHLGGFANLGKGYGSVTNANHVNYSLDLSKLKILTHDSLVNVINNLYDLNLTFDTANGGTMYRQTLNIGTTNKAKLTADEIAIATNKGWDVL